jgi:excisionase family DNA binding protein
MKNLLTVAEAADALNIKVATVRAWLAQRKLPRVNCGRAVRVPGEAITTSSSAIRFLPRMNVDEGRKIGKKLR